MSADFWAGYLSGAAGIVIGNPLDIVKVRLQAVAATNAVAPPDGTAVGSRSAAAGLLSSSSAHSAIAALARGIAPPLLTYGPLNALLFVSYNRSLQLLDPSISDPSDPPSTTSLASIWIAGVIGGFATWIVSTPTESIKCRAQVQQRLGPQSPDTAGGSFAVARQLWLEGSRSDEHAPRWRRGLRGLHALYTGGTVTSVRDAVGYGFYFWSYELSKRAWPLDEPDARHHALRVLLCGGVAGVVTWASVFPLDVVKTRLQTQDLIGARAAEGQALLPDAAQGAQGAPAGRRGAWQIAKQMYLNEGLSAFFRGLGVCSVRAFVVNAVQWTVYEWTMEYLRK